jgi:hypothetical protein
MAEAVYLQLSFMADSSQKLDAVRGIRVQLWESILR